MVTKNLFSSKICQHFQKSNYNWKVFFSIDKTIPQWILEILFATNRKLFELHLMPSTTSIVWCPQSEEDINNVVYASTNDTTLEGINLFWSFINKNLKNYEQYEQMHPVSNWPARLYWAVENHKFEHPFKLRKH